MNLSMIVLAWMQSVSAPQCYIGYNPFKRRSTFTGQFTAFLLSGTYQYKAEPSKDQVFSAEICNLRHTDASWKQLPICQILPGPFSHLEVWVNRAALFFDKLTAHRWPEVEVRKSIWKLAAVPREFPPLISASSRGCQTVSSSFWSFWELKAPLESQLCLISPTMPPKLT